MRGARERRRAHDTNWGELKTCNKNTKLCPCLARSQDFTQKPLDFDQGPSGPRICSCDESWGQTGFTGGDR